MSTITQEIVKARYDLRDEHPTQYSDATLIDYYNRSLEALASYLASVNSDWVFSDSTETISSGDNFIVLPADFASPISVEINNTPLTRKATRVIKTLQQETSAGTPEFYSTHKLNMIFERSAGADTDVYIQYNTAYTELSLGDDMPYNNNLNNLIRSSVVMLAKNRNERDITGSYALHNFYAAANMGDIVRRSYKTTVNLGF